MFTKGQSGELAWVTSSNIPSPLKWFLGPFSDFASSLKVDQTVLAGYFLECIFVTPDHDYCLYGVDSLKLPVILIGLIRTHSHHGVIVPAIGKESHVCMHDIDQQSWEAKFQYL